MQAELFNIDNTFGMFTDKGNEEVLKIVARARLLGSAWLEVYQELVNLSNVEGFEEATDTEVREAVYCALGGDNVFYYGA